MRWGLSAAPCYADDGLYVQEVNTAAINTNFMPKVLYAIACQETIDGQRNGSWNAATVCSGDGGHGLCQLTSTWPSNWQDPQANAEYAVHNYLEPAFEYWYAQGYRERGLVKLAAATYNAGLGNAIAGHNLGNADLYTTDEYGTRIVNRLDAMGYFG